VICSSEQLAPCTVLLQCIMLPVPDSLWGFKVVTVIIQIVGQSVLTLDNYTFL